jgi:hypothetical protein
VKDNFKNITIIVAILLNILQFLSSEAREWYSVMQQSQPSVSNEKMIVDALPVERIEPKSEIIKAKGVK